MPSPLRVLQIAHGYPPHEVAGVEQHTRALALELSAQGHRVHIFTATRAPGRPQYGLLHESDGPVSVTRVINNIPARPLSSAEQDSAIEHHARCIAARFRPDVVHIQHIQFLSSGLQFDAPVVVTLHDGWGWCPSGGTELLPDRRRCDGPAPFRCGPCYAAWRPVPTPTAHHLMRLAGRLAPVIAPERLHRLWSRLPDRLRLPVARQAPSPMESSSAVRIRAAAMQRFFQSAALRLSPSRYLAARAQAHGLGPVQVHENGSSLQPRPRRGGGPLVFLGTLSPHKGPDLVLSAWRQAFPSGDPPLRFFGPRGASSVPSHLWGGVLGREGVSAVLSEARALVMGSRWAENAPLVILEARAAGCPVIAPRLGGIPELLDEGRDGYLYPAGDVPALASCLRRVVATPPGPSRPPPTASAQASLLVSRYRALL